MNLFAINVTDDSIIHARDIRVTTSCPSSSIFPFVLRNIVVSMVFGQPTPALAICRVSSNPHPLPASNPKSQRQNPPDALSSQQIRPLLDASSSIEVG